MLTIKAVHETHDELATFIASKHKLPHAAEDLASDAFAIAVARGHFTDDSPVSERARKCLWTAADLCVKNYRRHQKRRRETEYEDTIGQFIDELERIAAGDTIATISTALTPAEKRALKLRLEGDRPLNNSEHAALHRARVKKIDPIKRRYRTA